MELWIRSQDRLDMVKANNFSITPRFIDRIDNSEIVSIYKGNKFHLGTYKTRERALEILDEIQNLLKPQIILRKGKITGCVDDTIFREPDGYDIKELSTYVYEMPKE